MVVEVDYGYMGIQHAILSTPVYIQNSLQYKVLKVLTYSRRESIDTILVLKAMEKYRFKLFSM